MKHKLLHVLLNPYVIAGVISLIIIFFLPDYFSKYKVENVNEEIIGKGSKVYYEDLNNDNRSEKIIAQETVHGDASLLLYKSNGDFVDQFNYTTQFPKKFKNLWFQDVNNNGFKEIYLVSQSKDSAFLNIFEPFAPQRIDRKHVFIDLINEYDNKYDFYVNKYENFFEFNTIENEIIFALKSGFSGSPRNVYKYDYENDTIIKSPHLTNSVAVSNILDLDDDGKNEITISNNTAGNTIDSIFTKRSDYSAWLTVLDDDLSFLFEPIEFQALGSLFTIPFKTNNENKLLGIFKSRQYDKLPTNLFVFSTLHGLEKEKILPRGKYSPIFKISENAFAFYEQSRGEVLFFNNEIEQIDSYKTERDATINYYDIDADGKKEWLVMNVPNQSTTIYREDFKNRVTFQNPSLGSKFLNCGITYISETETQLYFQDETRNRIFSYQENPMYLFRYLIYLGVYGVVLSIVLLILKGQKLRIEKQRAIENQISKLQIKTVKNQVDPHFVFNAINTISEMTLMDNKIEVDNFICRFSDFMRDTLKHSDKIETTLKDEIDYVENFIKLQKIRYKNSFDYKININKNVNLKTSVPKHVLFCYVENAIKHGLALKANGLLKINAVSTKDKLILTIEDNGGGLRKPKLPKKNSTGNGLLIMERIFELFSKLNKRTITHSITELVDANKNKIGVSVKILISKPKK